MGKVADYVNSLAGKENIDGTVIASTLLELHNEEMGIAEGKIAKLETDFEGTTSEIAERNRQITELKAKNWDLVTRVPASEDGKTPANNEDSDVDVSNASFDDFFEKED
jgi:hypothetical protein